MSNVVLNIGGRKFTVACGDGEEDRIADLGRMIDRKVRDLGDNAHQNEVRMLLYAALVLADELDEARSAPPPAPASPLAGSDMAGRLAMIAGKLENLAGALEQRQRSS